jgi:hypothetical protein
LNGARAHSRQGKAREHATGGLRLLVFSSFCSGIPAAEKKKESLNAEILLTHGHGHYHAHGGPNFCFRHRGHTRAIAKSPLYAHKMHTKVTLYNLQWL